MLLFVLLNRCVLLVCAFQGYTEAQYVDEAIAFITNHLKVNGPYDGLIGFSQGALLSNFLAGLQEKVRDAEHVLTMHCAWRFLSRIRRPKNLPGMAISFAMQECPKSAEIEIKFINFNFKIWEQIFWFRILYCALNPWIKVHYMVWQGLALHDVPPIRLMILISPAKGPPPHYSVYEKPAIKCPALVFLGTRSNACLFLKTSFSNLSGWFEQTPVSKLTSEYSSISVYGHLIPTGPHLQ